MAAQRAVGIIRVSRVGGRDAERFVSPDEQRERIEHVCKREGYTLVDTIEELDISGGKPLDQRPGLSRAVRMIEAGEAHVLICAYFDRLVRSLKVQQEVVERVEAAGGEVLLADFGKLTNGTAVERLNGQLIGAVTEYVRRSIAERTAAGREIALSRGHFPGVLIAGLRRDEHGQAEIDPDAAEAVREAFELRAGGATIAVVRAHLAAHGIERGHQGVYKLLANRQAVGEFVWGDFHGTVPAIVDRATFDRVQRSRHSRGRRAKSERLLARLGVLRCATCGGRMVLGRQIQGGHTYVFYRCGAVRADCGARPAITADTVERLVADAVQEALADVVGRAGRAGAVRDAADALEQAQAALSAALRAFTGLEGEDAARERLAELGAARDEAQARLDQLGDHADVTVTAGADWGRLTLAERRALIRAVIARVDVAPGRGSDRVTVRLVGD